MKDRMMRSEERIWDIQIKNQDLKRNLRKGRKRVLRTNFGCSNQNDQEGMKKALRVKLPNQRFHLLRWEAGGTKSNRYYKHRMRLDIWVTKPSTSHKHVLLAIICKRSRQQGNIKY